MFMESREKALLWWSGLTFEEKFIAMVKGKRVVIGYPDRNPDTLTGREIELLMIELMGLGLFKAFCAAFLPF